MPPILSVQQLTVRYAGAVALDNISFDVDPGEYVGLIGPNGAGKSTLLRTLVGLVQPDIGRVARPPIGRVGYVPQSILGQSIVALSVREVLGMGLAERGILGLDMDHLLMEKLQAVGLGKGAVSLASNFNALSGGQKQRVIIARALVHDPTLLLFDEPLSGVDYQTKLAIYDLLSDLNGRLGLTILFVSHEVEHITRKCHRILCLNQHLHEGCHPMDFARGEVRPYEEKEEVLTFVHHHHHHKEGDAC